MSELARRPIDLRADAPSLPGVDRAACVGLRSGGLAALALPCVGWEHARRADAARAAQAAVVAVAVAVVTLTALDHWTTYLCLAEPVAGWQALERNPVAGWLFARLGLLPGLALDSGVTVSAVAAVARTDLLPRGAGLACLLLLAAITGFAFANNCGALATLGISPFGC